MLYTVYIPLFFLVRIMVDAPSMTTIFIFSISLKQHIENVHTGQKDIFQMSLYSPCKAQYIYITSYVLGDVFRKTFILYSTVESIACIVLKVKHMENYISVTDTVRSAGYVWCSISGNYKMHKTQPSDRVLYWHYFKNFPWTPHEAQQRTVWCKAKGNKVQKWAGWKIIVLFWEYSISVVCIYQLICIYSNE